MKELEVKNFKDCCDMVEEKNKKEFLEEFKNTQIQTKGKIDFYYDTKQLNSIVYDRNYYKKLFNNDEDYLNYYFDSYPFKFDSYDYMSGENFLDAVESGCIIDYDGSLCEVVVDGYLSNFGLSYKGLHQGKFKVSGKVWKQLCKEHEIMVNWANR